MKMIKRICVAASALLVCIACSGCGNKDVFDTVYTFSKAICYGDFNDDGIAEWRTFELDSWTDYEDGDSIQIQTKDGDVYLLHSTNCTLKK